MKSRGRLSPWITPRTIRPPYSHGISKLTSVPARALPTRTQGAETSQPVDGKPKHTRHGRRLQCEIGPAAGDLADLGKRLGAAAFERMRGTEFAGEYQPSGEPIDGDDRIAACDPRRH
jgi:hypothetical protein